MTSLIACLGAGKGTWVQVSRLIESQAWESIVLITNPFGLEKFNNTKNAQLVVIDDRKDILDLVEDIKKALDGKFFGDVAVNFVSGDGKVHMALLSALLKLGVGIRLVDLTKDGFKEI
ncbi:MAG: hypothetical protein QW666_02750 [Candidatus Woesearchaeota archaeon]